jgi:hypothetical protein
MKKTKWFPANVKPAREGVYQRKYSWGVDYAYFNGRDWGVSEDTTEGAFLWRNTLSAMECKWRGLTAPAK